MKHQSPDALRRRAITGAGAFVIGSGFVAGTVGGWAMQLDHLPSDTMAGLILLARDLHAGDGIPDEAFAVALKGYDTKEARPMIVTGIAALDDVARLRGYRRYLDMDYEADRQEVLREVHDSAFVRSLRAGLVTALHGRMARSAVP